MVSLKKITRQSTGSNAPTPSAPIDYLPAFTGPDNRVMRVLVGADSLDSVYLPFFTRHSSGSTASISFYVISPPVSGHQSSGVSRSVGYADFLVSVHTLSFIHQSDALKSTRSSATTYFTPISPPVVVNQASGASRAVVMAESPDLVQMRFLTFFIQPDKFWFSLGCSTDRSTAASMVIAHKVGRCAGKASLYAWNSFIPEDFSPVLVDLRFHYVIALDLMTDFVMDSYSMFPGLDELIVPPGTNHDDDKIFGENLWLDLKSELMLIYGSLWRPPEFCSATSSWPISVELVCVWLKHSISRHPGSRIAYCGVAYKLWKVLEASFKYHNESRQGEQWLANFTQHFECDVARHGLEICAVDCYTSLRLVSLFCEDGVMMMMHKAVFKLPASQGEFLLSVSVWKLLLSSSKATKSRRLILELLKEYGLIVCKHVSTLLELDLQLRQDCGVNQLSHNLFASHTAHLLATSSVLYYLELLLQQILPQVLLQRQSLFCGFLDHMLQARSGWFMSILELLYCSLPRPPEEHYAFSSNSH